jgi:PKD repeat protein
VAFGPTASHVFADNGSYTGLLTATDQTGNTATKTFAVSITNVTPATDAGPDAGGLWGVPIALNGAGTDPGSADQATLKYQWNFGDGSPSASGGGSVSHAYATPGTYTATLQVCDKDLACSIDTASVTVTKRGTSVGNSGATAGIFDTPATLQASLVDQLGSPVNARTVSFTVTGEAADRPDKLSWHRRGYLRSLSRSRNNRHNLGIRWG